MTTPESSRRPARRSRTRARSRSCSGGSSRGGAGDLALRKRRGAEVEPPQTLFHESTDRMAKDSQAWLIAVALIASIKLDFERHSFKPKFTKLLRFNRMQHAPKEHTLRVFRRIATLFKILSSDDRCGRRMSHQSAVL